MLPYCVKILANGLIVTVAGGVPATGYFGTGGLGVLARLSGPGAVASDGMGGAYFADKYACAVRRVRGNDTFVSLVAGTGVCGTYTGEGGPATLARIGSVASIALDLAGGFLIVRAELVLRSGWASW